MRIRWSGCPGPWLEWWRPPEAAGKARGGDFNGTRTNGTDPETFETVLAVYARTAGIRESCCETGIPKSTITDIVNSDPDRFQRYRTLVRIDLVEKAWSAFEAGITRATDLIATSQFLTDVVSAIKVLHSVIVTASGIKAEDLLAAKTSLPSPSHNEGRLTADEIAQTLRGLDGL